MNIDFLINNIIEDNKNSIWLIIKFLYRKEMALVGFEPTTLGL